MSVGILFSTIIVILQFTHQWQAAAVFAAILTFFAGGRAGGAGRRGRQAAGALSPAASPALALSFPPCRARRPGGLPQLLRWLLVLWARDQVSPPSPGPAPSLLGERQCRSAGALAAAPA